MKDIKLGLLGLGYWGKNILRNLSELGVLSLAFDSCREVADERKKDYPHIHFTSDIEELLNSDAIQGVVISTPASTHFDLVKKALEKGKDVLVEKPLSLKQSQGEELRALALEKKRILMVGHILMYHPAIKKLKSLIKEGRLGKIRYIYSNRLNIGKLRTEENILWSFAPHDISVILMLMGEEPEKVTAFGGDYLSPGVYDTTLTSLEFKNNVKGHVFVSWLHPYKEQKLIVVGSETMAVFDDVSEEKLFLFPHQIVWEDGKIPVAHKAERLIVEVERAEPLKEEFLHFLECVRERKSPDTDADEALRVLRALELAEKSLRENLNG